MHETPFLRLLLSDTMPTASRALDNPKLIAGHVPQIHAREVGPVFVDHRVTRPQVERERRLLRLYLDGDYHDRTPTLPSD